MARLRLGAIIVGTAMGGIGAREIASWVDGGTVKDAARRYYLRYSGPGGMTEADDMENWSHASAATQGAIARRRKFNYQLGLNRDLPERSKAGRIRRRAHGFLPPLGGEKE